MKITRLELRGAAFDIYEDTLHRGAPVPHDGVHTLFECRRGKACDIVIKLMDAGVVSLIDGRIHHHEALDELAHRKAVSAVRAIAGKSKTAKTRNSEKPITKPVISMNKGGAIAGDNDEDGIKRKAPPHPPKENNKIIITKHAHARGGELSLEIKDKPKKKGFGKAEAEIFIKLYNQFAEKQAHWRMQRAPPTDFQIKRMARCVADAQKQGYRIKDVLQRATEALWLNNDMSQKMNLNFFTAPANPKREVVIYKIMNGEYDDPTGKYGINGNRQRGDGGGESAARRAGRRALEQVCGEAGQPDESGGAGQVGGDVIHADYSVQE